MQPHREVHEPRLLARDVAIQPPILRTRADGDHRLDARLARSLQDRFKRALARERFEMRVRIDEPHARGLKVRKTTKPAHSRASFEWTTLDSKTCHSERSEVQPAGL